MSELTLEFAKGGIALFVTLIGLGVGWLVGQRLTYQWNLRQKQREMDLAAAQDLQQLYGEFFAIWNCGTALLVPRGRACSRHPPICSSAFARPRDWSSGYWLS